MGVDDVLGLVVGGEVLAGADMGILIGCYDWVWEADGIDGTVLKPPWFVYW